MLILFVSTVARPRLRETDLIFVASCASRWIVRENGDCRDQLRGHAPTRGLNIRSARLSTVPPPRYALRRGRLATESTGSDLIFVASCASRWIVHENGGSQRPTQGHAPTRVQTSRSPASYEHFSFPNFQFPICPSAPSAPSLSTSSGLRARFRIVFTTWV